MLLTSSGIWRGGQSPVVFGEIGCRPEVSNRNRTQRDFELLWPQFDPPGAFFVQVRVPVPVRFVPISTSLCTQRRLHAFHFTGNEKWRDQSQP
jgi:hypothetical protein